MSVSDTETRCECCDLPLYSCGKGLALTQAAERRAQRERALQRPGVIPAHHDGTCPSCGTRYLAGEPIRRTDDGWVSVLCCPDALDD